MKNIILFLLIIFATFTNTFAQQGYIGVSVQPNCGSYAVSIGYSAPCQLLHIGTMSISGPGLTIGNIQGTTYYNPSMILLPNSTYTVTVRTMKWECDNGQLGWDGISTSFTTPPLVPSLTITGWPFTRNCEGIGRLAYHVNGGDPNAPVTVTGGGGRVGFINQIAPTATSFTITASQGECSVTETFEFDAAPPPLAATGSFQLNCNGGGRLTVSANNGLGFQLLANGSPVANPFDSPTNTLPAMSISQLGCLAGVSVDPPIPAPVITATGVFEPNCAGGGRLTVSVDNGLPFQLLANGSPVANPFNTTTTVLPAMSISQLGCIGNVTMLPSLPLPTLTGTAVFQRNCGGGGTLSIGNGFTLFVNGSQVSSPHVTTTGTEPPAFTVRQGACAVTIDLQIEEPPASLSVGGVFTTNCNNPNTGNLVVTGSGTFSIQVSDNNGSNPQNLGTHTLPASFNGISATHVRISSGTCHSPWTAFSFNITRIPDYNIIGGTYFYCDPRGTYPQQDGVLTVQLGGNYIPGGSYDVWSVASGGTVSATPIFTLVANGSGVLQGRVPVLSGFSCGNAPDPVIPSPACEDLTQRYQVFNVKVNLAGQTDCQTEVGKIEQIANESMTVEVVSPPTCLATGDEVTLNFTVRAPYVRNYVDKVFIIEAFFAKPSAANTNIPNFEGRVIPLNEIQYIDARAVGTVDDATGTYTFPMTFRFKAPFMLTNLAVTHRSGDNRQPLGYYASNCYKDPVRVNKMFMPKLPSPSITLSGNCGATYTTSLNLDPMICQLRPSEWEIVGVNNGVTSIVGTFNANNTTPTCNIPVSLSIPSSLEGLLLRHKLTQCTAPISIISGGNGNGGVSSNNGITITTLDGCSGNSAVSGYELSAPPGYNSYLWHPTNETTQTIFVTQAGTYSVSVVNASTNCNSQLPSVTVGPPPPTVPQLTANLIYTSCTTARLTAVSGFDSYAWYNSSGVELGHDLVFTATFAGTYTLVAMKGECKKTLDIQVTFPQLQVFANPMENCDYVLQASTGFDSYLWSNGATTSNITATSSGTYTVTATQGSCTQTASIHIDPVSGVVTLTINIPTLRMKNVLATSAATFSEQWLRTGSPLISSPSGFGNGGRGIWKPHETYAYITDRDRATGNNGEFITPKVATDGIFNLNMFNWRYLGALNCSEWLKTQQITQYNPFNFEIENKDILDRYTAALYGYKNQLPIATVGNARVDEVAFESFEEYPDEQITSTDVSGTDNNLDLVTQSSNNIVDSYQLLLVDLGVPKSSMTKHVAYVKGSLFSAANSGTFPTPIEVVIKGFRLDPNNPGVFIWRAKIISFRVSSNVTELVLESTNATEIAPTCYWKGELGIRKDERLAVTMNATATLQDVHKHTGKKALKLTKNGGDEVFFKMTPKRLHTIPNKKYVFSTWVKLANTCFLEGSMAKTGLSKEETSKDAPAESVADEASAEKATYPVSHPCDNRNPARKADYVDKVYFTFENPGDVTNTLDPVVYSDVIEGWVRIEHEFVAGGNFVEITCYNKNTKFDILFIDDIRIHPFNSSLQTYVYDTQNYKLRATLDGNNFSSLYFYDEQGNLYLTKKETERGIQTIQESSSHQPKQR